MDDHFNILEINKKNLNFEEFKKLANQYHNTEYLTEENLKYLFNSLNTNENEQIALNTQDSFLNKNRNLLETIWSQQSLDDKLETEKFETFLNNNFSVQKNNIIRTFQGNDIKNIETQEQFIQMLTLCPIRQVSLSLNTNRYPSKKRQTTIENSQDSVRMFNNFFAGACAGIISRTFTAPVDRLRYIVAATESLEKSVHDLFINIQKTEGFVGQWRGNLVNCMKIGPEAGIKFFTQDFLTQNQLQRNHDKPKFTERLMSGAFSGLISQFLIQPLDLAKIRLALTHRKVQRSFNHLMAHVQREEGFPGFQRGLIPSLYGVTIYTALELSLQSQIKDIFNIQREQKVNPLIFSMLGGLACLISSVVAQPFNVVRSRIIKQYIPGNAMQQKSFMDCFKVTQQRYGLQGLQRGFVTSSCKSVPAVAISFTVQEFTLKTIRKLQLHE